MKLSAVNNTTHVLIVCYAYPPYPGIVGRRWVKFAKELTKNEVKVSVISSEPPASEHSVWRNEANLLNHIVLPLKYPRSLILFPKSFFGRLRYKLDLIWVKFFSRGNYYDRTIFWKMQLMNTYSKLIKTNDFTHVVISAAPFFWLGCAEELKKLNPKIQFIADIRDPWTTNKSAYGFSGLSSVRMNVEKKKEVKMLEDFDKVITVNESITDYFKAVAPNYSEKIFTIPNGFDLDETTRTFPSDLIWNEEKINLVFTGSFYSNANYLFEALQSSLKKMKQELATLSFHFYFLGPNVDSLKASLDKDLICNFTFGYYQDLSNINAVIEKANYAMLFLTDDINNSLSTKFCEYIKFKKKIIVFSKAGFTSDYIKKKHIGYHFTENEIEQGLRVLEKLYKEDKFPDSFNVNEFSVTDLTKKMLSILQLKLEAD